jgi:hypothetical protein
LRFAPVGGLWISSINLETTPHIASRANVVSMLLPHYPWQVLEYVAAKGVWAQAGFKSCCRHASKRCLEPMSGSALVYDGRDPGTKGMDEAREGSQKLGLVAPQSIHSSL